MNIINTIFTRSFAPPTTAVNLIWDGERIKKEIARLSEELEAHKIYLNHHNEFGRTIHRIVERRETPEGEDANILLSFQLFLMTIDPTVKERAEISNVLKASTAARSILYSMITGGFSRDQYPFVVCEHIIPFYTDEEIRATINKIEQHNYVGACVSTPLVEFLALTACWSIEQKNRFFTSLFSGLVGRKKEIFLAKMHQELSHEKLTNCCAKGGDVLKLELQAFTKMCNNHLEAIQKAIDHEDLVSISSDVAETRLYLLMRLRTIYKDNLDKFAFVASAMESDEWTWLKEQIFPKTHYAALYHRGEGSPFFLGSVDCFNSEVTTTTLQVLSWVSYVATTSQKKGLPVNNYGYFYYLSTEFVNGLNGWALLSDSILKPFAHQLSALFLAANVDNFSDSLLERLFPILIKELPDKFHEFCLSIIQQKKTDVEKLFIILEKIKLLDYALQFFNSGKLTAASWIQLFCTVSPRYQGILLKNFFTSATTSKGAFAIRPSSVEIFCDYLVASYTQSKEFSPDTARLFTHSLRQKLNGVSPNLPKVVAQELKKRGVKELSALITELELDEKEASDPKMKQQRVIKQLTDLLSTPPTTVTLNLAAELAKEVDLKTLGEIRKLFSSIPMHMWPLLFYVGKSSFNFASLYPKEFQGEEAEEWWKQTVGFAIKELISHHQHEQVKRIRENLFQLLLATKSTTLVLTHCVITYSLPEFFALLVHLRAFQSTKLSENSLYHQARVLFFAHSTSKVAAITSLLYEYWQNPFLNRDFDADCAAKELLSEPLCLPAEQQQITEALTKQTNFFSFFYHATAIHENLFTALHQVHPKDLPELIKSWINLVMTSDRQPLIKKQFILFFLEGAARVKLDSLNLISAVNPLDLSQLFRENPEPSNLHSTTYLQVITLSEDYCEFLLRTLTDFIRTSVLISFSLTKFCENLALLNKKELFLDFLAKNKDKKLLQQYVNERFAICCQSGPHLLSLVVVVIPDWKVRLADLIKKIRYDDQEDDGANSNLTNLQASLRAANLLAEFESSFPETTESKEGKQK